MLGLILVLYEKLEQVHAGLRRDAQALQNWTLRDVRRNISSKSRKYRSLEFLQDLWMAMNWGTFPNLETSVNPWACVDIQKFADALIGRYGHKALVSDVIAAYLADYNRQQADRTNHHADNVVAPTTSGNIDAETHGGDGNSGDIDSPAETSTDDREAEEASTGNGAAEGDPSETKGGGKSRSSDNPQPSASSQTAGNDNEVVESNGATGASSDNTNEVGAPEDDKMVANATTGQSGEGACGTDEATAGLTNQTTIDESRNTDQHQAVGQPDPTLDLRDSMVDTNGLSVDGDVGAPIDEISEEFDVNSSERNTDVSGKQQPQLIDFKSASQIAAISRSLQNLVGTLSSNLPIPRWDGRKVVEELVSRQNRIHRMRQVQRTPVCVLVVGDVSGSCEWLSNLTMPVVFGLAKRCPMVIGTYTGDLGREGTFWPDRIIGRQAYKFRHLPPMDYPSVALWKLYKAAGITHLLVVGDVHGHYSYRNAADAGINVLWCNPNKRLQPDEEEIAKRNIKYILIQDEDIARAISKLV
jgi:hypothetical protein